LIGRQDSPPSRKAGRPRAVQAGGWEGNRFITLPPLGVRARTIGRGKEASCATHGATPAIIRPSFHARGAPAGLDPPTTPEELEEAVRWGLQQSPAGNPSSSRKSVIGWKGIRARGDAPTLADNVVKSSASIENVDPMGVPHRATRWTVAPAQTLTDKEYQVMRDAGPSRSSARNRRRDGRPPTSSSRSTRTTGALGGHRDEPARVALPRPLASKATGFPPSRRSPPKPRRGLPASTELRKRHHAGDAGLVRAGPSTYLRREVPRAGPFEKFPEADRTADHAE